MTPQKSYTYNHVLDNTTAEDDESYLIIQIPYNITEADVKEMADYFELVLQQTKRRADWLENMRQKEEGRS